MTTVTVLSGPERRRRWSASEKAQIVEERGGWCSLTEVARRHDMHHASNLLHHWRRQARLGAADSSPIKFLPVSVAQRRSPSAGVGTIEIELEGGIRVRVDAAIHDLPIIFLPHIVPT